MPVEDLLAPAWQDRQWSQAPSGPARPGSTMTLPALHSLACEVAVFFARSEVTLSSAQQAVLAAVLSRDERARAERFRFDEDRRTYVIAHALLRRALAAQASVPADSFVFRVGEHGRPELEQPQGARRLRFNLSHTRGCVVVAVTYHADIGVDVESVERRVEHEPVGRRVFSDAELHELQALPAQQQRARFFDLWTLKEAYIKAIGQGLSAPLRAITFTAAAPDPVPVRFDPPITDDAAAWTLRRHVPFAGYRIAVAWRGDHAQRVRFIETTAEALLTA